MAITQAKTYVPMLDEVYKAASLTSILDANEQMVKMAENGKDFLVPMMELDGLGDTTRGGDYVEGDETLTWETKTPNYDRNRMFKIDAMDNIETAGVAYGMLSAEFIRTKVVPEVDAFRLAAYYTAGTKATAAALSTGDAVIAALRTASNSMDEAEVPAEGRILYITPTLHGLIADLDTTKSREVLAKFSQIVDVPQTRFYSAITLKDGTSSGNTAGGYAKASGAANLNFLCIHPTAVVQSLKHVAPKIVTPEQNQTGDNWKFGYRVYAIAVALDNKVSGIYGHAAA